MKTEFPVGVRTGGTDMTTKLAYTIDISRGGAKIGSPALYLAEGWPVELVVDRAGEKALFAGHVARKDEMQYIDRIRRSGYTFFIRIEDAKYTEFVAQKFFI